MRSVRREPGEDSWHIFPSLQTAQIGPRPAKIFSRQRNSPPADPHEFAISHLMQGTGMMAQKFGSKCTGVEVEPNRIRAYQTGEPQTRIRPHNQKGKREMSENLQKDVAKTDDALLIDEFEIVELEDRLELAGRCNGRCDGKVAAE